MNDDDLQPGRTLRDLRVRRNSTPLIAASYDGICSVCYGDINAGDRIVYRGDAWIHEECQ